MGCLKLILNLHKVRGSSAGKAKKRFSVTRTLQLFSYEYKKFLNPEPKTLILGVRVTKILSLATAPSSVRLAPMHTLNFVPRYAPHHDAMIRVYLNCWLLAIRTYIQKPQDRSSQQGCSWFHITLGEGKALNFAVGPFWPLVSAQNQHSGCSQWTRLLT